jgi:hypothetical protein
MLTFEAPNMCRLVSRVEGFVADTALLQDNDVVVVPVEKLAARRQPRGLVEKTTRSFPRHH